MTLVGLISDVHADPESVAEALSIFSKKGVENVLCAGDIAGYRNKLDETISLLLDSKCQCIVGNHDLSYLQQHKDEPGNVAMSFLANLPRTFVAEYAEKNLYMVHAQPPDACHGGIKLLDKQGLVRASSVDQWAEKLQNFDYDILVVGHTHQVFVEQIAGTLVINPGSSVFNHCCAILRLPEMTVELIALSGKKIVKNWNWGQHINLPI